MKDFYIRTERVWVKVSRRADKSFIFSIGYKGQLRAFTTNSYPHEFMPTISDARIMASVKAADYK